MTYFFNPLLRQVIRDQAPLIKVPRRVRLPYLPHAGFGYPQSLLTQAARYDTIFSDEGCLNSLGHEPEKGPSRKG